MSHAEQLFHDIETAINNSNKQYDLLKIRKAFQVAYVSHNGQKRKSGAPYIEHPVSVALILLELGMDTDSVVSGLLHDTVEDTYVTVEEVKKDFGEDVALLVDGVTKLGQISYSSSELPVDKEQRQAENVRKMLLAMSKDVRVIIIKLADRLHNMRTLNFVAKEKQLKTSLETMEIFAPLAHRLGISGVKEELEDIALLYLDDVASQEIEDQLSLNKVERGLFLERIIEKIEKRLEEDHITAQLSGRIKSIYGIYRKVYMQGRDIDEIYDVYAVRIIVDTVSECYNILGIIHDMLTPIPNRFKDYISTPKSNMYQSLHTTVIDREGIPFEVQIRTWEMHRTAEYGVAAHWKYKEGLKGKDALEGRLAWIRKLLEAQKDSEDASEIVKSIKSDIAPEEVFVYTPNGDVKSLPVGATAIDFAYAIHSGVGNKMTGAKVNGKMRSIDYKVKTGDVVEIITKQGADIGPTRDWLNIVKTSEARNKIRNWFKKEKRDENIAQGRDMIEKELRRALITFPAADKDEYMQNLAVRQKFNSIDDFYAAIGYGGIAVSRIMPRIKEDFTRLYRSQPEPATRPVKEKKNKASSGVIVEGLDSCLVKFAKCCTPVPGDDIIGFVTRGFGVSIHKKSCVNAKNVENQPERWVNCQWASNVVKESFQATIEIIGVERTGLLADISIALGNMRVAIHTLLARQLNSDNAMIQVTISIQDVAQLQNIISVLQKINGVDKVHRIGQ